MSQQFYCDLSIEKIVSYQLLILGMPVVEAVYFAEASRLSGYSSGFLRFRFELWGLMYLKTYFAWSSRCLIQHLLL